MRYNNDRIFSCHIAMSEQRRLQFSMSYRKGANDNTTIRTSQYARSCGMMMKRNNQIFMLSIARTTTSSIFLTHIMSKLMSVFLYTSRVSERTSMGQKSIIARMWGSVARVWHWWPTTQQSNLSYSVNRNDDGKQARITRSNDNEHTFNVVLQEKRG